MLRPIFISNIPLTDSKKWYKDYYYLKVNPDYGIPCLRTHGIERMVIVDDSILRSLELSHIQGSLLSVKCFNRYSLEQSDDYQCIHFVLQRDKGIIKIEYFESHSEVPVYIVQRVNGIPEHDPIFATPKKIMNASAINDFIKLALHSSGSTNINQIENPNNVLKWVGLLNEAPVTEAEADDYVWSKRYHEVVIKEKVEYSGTYYIALENGIRYPSIVSYRSK